MASTMNVFKEFNQAGRTLQEKGQEGRRILQRETQIFPKMSASRLGAEEMKDIDDMEIDDPIVARRMISDGGPTGEHRWNSTKKLVYSRSAMKR